MAKVLKEEKKKEAKASKQPAISVVEKRPVRRTSKAFKDEVLDGTEKTTKAVKSTTALAERVPKSEKPKRFKLERKQYEGGTHHPGKSKKPDMAKFLLEKAKQANILQEQARAKRLAAAKKPAPVQRKEFVLPKQSSRSSRVIKPNKRFLEEEGLSPSPKKKTKLEDETNVGSPLSTTQSPFSVSVAKSLTLSPSVSKDIFPIRTVGLLDQPLIVAGKRDRKPSLKLQLSEEDSFSPEKAPLLSPLAAPKLGTGLLQQSKFEKTIDKPKFSMFATGRKHGASIVQKAKLHLNRAALNKSKAALARALKAEMKREAKFIEQASHQPVIPEEEHSAGGKINI